jgi:hypothetical protein
MAENSREQIRHEIAVITRQCDALAERTRQVQRHAATVSRELHDLLQRAEAAAERARKIR